MNLTPTRVRIAVILLSLAVVLPTTYLFYQHHSKTDSKSAIIHLDPDQATLFNADKLEESIYAYMWETKLSPRDMQQLVKSEFLEDIPINPYSNMPMKAIRIGDVPCYGDYTYFSAYREENDQGKIERIQRGYWLIVYGSKPYDGLLAWSTKTFGEDIANKIIYQSGSVFVDCVLMPFPVTVRYQSPESVLLENGYEF